MRYTQVNTSNNQITKKKRKPSTITRKTNKLTIGENANPYFEESEAAKKLSNITLSPDQLDLRTTILQFIKDNLQAYNNGLNNGKPSVFIINGDAGTGKSVILNSLFNEIQRLSKTSNKSIVEDNLIFQGTKNYLVVNHPEMLKLYHQISRRYSYILKSDLERPTSLINKYINSADSKVDVLIIDEAHLLATSKDAFKRFHQDNHLVELFKIAKVVIMVFDENQSLRMGSYWSLDSGNKAADLETDGASLNRFLDNNHIAKFQFHQLHKQFRITANEHILNWIKQVTMNKNPSPLLPIHNDPNFQLKFFENCQTMYEWIQWQNSHVGQSRILSTYDFPYRLDGKDYFVYSANDGFKLRWDRYLPNLTTPWSERIDTIDEVGSVYTIQGFDLNFAGVILGRSIGWDHQEQCLKIKPEYYDDHAGFTKKKNIFNVDKVKEKIILNSLNVLLSRGVKGLYVYAWDKELREVLLNSVSDDFIVRG